METQQNYLLFVIFTNSCSIVVLEKPDQHFPALLNQLNRLKYISTPA